MLERSRFHFSLSLSLSMSLFLIDCLPSKEYPSRALIAFCSRFISPAVTVSLYSTFFFDPVRYLVIDACGWILGPCCLPTVCTYLVMYRFFFFPLFLFYQVLYCLYLSNYVLFT